MKMPIDLEEMKQIFNADFSYFETLGEVREGKTGKHIFIDNGGSVLGIAHLDNVNEDTHFHPITIRGRDIILSTRCDDRVGVYILLKLLPLFCPGIDILLTDDEEIGKSTGAEFEPAKQYNWMFQFDRRTDDAVMYCYDVPDWKETLAKSFKMGFGSASDISRMEHMKCKAVNIGCGYSDEHSLLAYLDIEMMKRQVGRFINFYHHNKNTYFPHEKKVYMPPTTWAGNGGKRWNTGGTGNQSNAAPFSGIVVPSGPTLPIIMNGKCKYCDIIMAGSQGFICSSCMDQCEPCIFCGTYYHLNYDNFWINESSLICEDCIGKISFNNRKDCYQVLHCINCLEEIDSLYIKHNGKIWCEECYHTEIEQQEPPMCQCEVMGYPMCGNPQCKHYDSRGGECILCSE